MSSFAVIDTETTWNDSVMSIGVAIAESETFELIDKRYYILTPYKDHGGMYTYALYRHNVSRCETNRQNISARFIYGRNHNFNRR